MFIPIPLFPPCSIYVPLQSFVSVSPLKKFGFCLEQYLLHISSVFLKFNIMSPITSPYISPTVLFFCFLIITMCFTTITMFSPIARVFFLPIAIFEISKKENIAKARYLASEAEVSILHTPRHGSDLHSISNRFPYWTS